MRKITIFLYLIIIISLLNACSDSNKETSESLNIQFEVPKTIEVNQGGEFILKVRDGKGPLTSDIVMVESSVGISYICEITKVDAESFTVHLNEDCTDGSYIFYIKRGDYKKNYGKLFVKIVEDINFIPDEGVTVYGVVVANGKRLSNVVVSDGIEVVVTNDKGIYQLKSTKKRGYVFVSVPSGYEAPSDGVLPQIHYTLKAKPEVREQIDFSLNEVENQDSYKVFMLGDMHLAKRTDDLKQFKDFTSDLTKYMAKHRGEKMYAIALGDMTWDLYWYSNNFYFPEYLNIVNNDLKDLQIYHVMGNHDKDFKWKSDLDASAKYVNQISPAYYSFNIGQVHYVVMDNINCDAYDGTESRNYIKAINNEQLEWLQKDLAYVSKETPVVIAAHAQTFYPTKTVPGASFKIDHALTNTTQLFEIIKGYETHFVTGHTHMMFNVIPESSITNGQKIYEHNSGSVCASWWWSGNLTPGVHISLDGTPGGYGVWDITSKDLKWQYKSTGWPESYQFRSYDLNTVSFSLADVPDMPSNLPNETKKVIQNYFDAYPSNSNNEILLNIWNWNPKWKIEVVDADGAKLDAKPVWAYDPLHIAALSIKRFNNAGLKSTPAFVTEEFTHFFKVQAKNAGVDLKITVTDEFGNTWIEDMQRPKAFSTDAYKTTTQFVNYY